MRGSSSGIDSVAICSIFHHFSTRAAIYWEGQLILLMNTEWTVSQPWSTMFAHINSLRIWIRGAALRQEFGMAMSPSLVFDFPNVRALEASGLGIFRWKSKSLTDLSGAPHPGIWEPMKTRTWCQCRITAPNAMTKLQQSLTITDSPSPNQSESENTNQWKYKEATWNNYIQTNGWPIKATNHFSLRRFRRHLPTANRNIHQSWKNCSLFSWRNTMRSINTVCFKGSLVFKT